MNRPIRVVLADDHSLFRQGLRSLLRLQPDIEVLGEVDRVSEIPSVLADHACDVLLLDLQMDRSSLDDIKSLSEITRVVIVTASELLNEALAAVRLGARAVVLKRYAVETLVDAIRAVAEGLVWMPPALQAAVTSQWEQPNDKQLTAREREIIRHVALGLRNNEVAKLLRISEGTVKTHMNNIFL